MRTKTKQEETVYFSYKMTVEEEYDIIKNFSKPQREERPENLIKIESGDNLVPSQRILNCELDYTFKRINDFDDKRDLDHILINLLHIEPFSNLINNIRTKLAEKVENLPFIYLLYQIINSLEMSSSPEHIAEVKHLFDAVFSNFKNLHEPINSYVELLEKIHNELIKKYTFTKDEWVTVENKKVVKTKLLYNEYSPIAYFFRGRFKKEMMADNSKIISECFNYVNLKPFGKKCSTSEMVKKHLNPEKSKINGHRLLSVDLWLDALGSAFAGPWSLDWDFLVNFIFY